MATALFTNKTVAATSVQVKGYQVNITATLNSGASAYLVVEGKNGQGWDTLGSMRLNTRNPQRSIQVGGEAYGVYRVRIAAISGSVTAAADIVDTPNHGSQPAPVIKLRKAVKRAIGGLGDSFVANCHSIVANAAYATEEYGFLGGLARLLGLFAPYTDNFGVVGDTSNGFIVRAPAAFNSTVTGVVITPGFTNDFTDATLTLDDTKANILKLLSIAQAAGKPWVVGTGTPRFGTKALPAAKAQAMVDLKDWILGTLSKHTPVVNTWDGFTQDMTVDDLHPNPLGQAFLTSRYAPVVSELYEFGLPPALTFAGQLFDAAKRPFGSLTANPFFLGANDLTAAAITATGAKAGSKVADGMLPGASNLVGVTTKWSVEPAPDGFGNAQVCELFDKMTTAGGYITFGPTAKPALTNFSAGDVIEAVAFVSNDADAPCLLSWQMELIVVKPIDGTSKTIYFRAMDKYQEPFAMQAKGGGFLESQRYTVDKTETSITWRLACYPANGIQQSNSKVKAWRAGLIKV